MNALRINVLAHEISNLFSALFYTKPETKKASFTWENETEANTSDNTLEANKPEKAKFKWEGSYEASLTI